MSPSKQLRMFCIFKTKNEIQASEKEKKNISPYTLKDKLFKAFQSHFHIYNISVPSYTVASRSIQTP